MSANIEDTPPPRRSTRERKQAEPFVSAPGPSTARKRKRVDANGDGDSGRKEAPRRTVQAARAPGPPPPPKVDVKKISVKAVQSGGLPDPFKGFRSIRDEGYNRMIFHGFTPESTTVPGIYVLDCGSLKSENILPTLRHDGVDGQFARQPFPPFRDPIVVLIKPVPGESFLIIFGGELQGQSRINSTLLYVDLTRKTWGEVPTNSSHPSPKGRVGAAACVVGSRLLIFGGRTAGNWEAASYSRGRISFNEETERIEMMWQVKDKAYPEEVPYSGYFGGFAALDGGRHVLLLPGGRGSKGKVTFSGTDDDDMTVYNTQTDLFFRIPSGGLRALPPVRWYLSMPPPTALAPRLPQIEIEAGRPPRPTDFLLAHTESMALEGDERNSHISHLWAVAVCTASRTIKVKKIGIEEEINRIWGEDKVEFFSFFTTAEKLCLWGTKEGEPAGSSPYVAEIDI